MTALARSAGVSKTTLYAKFPTKAALFRAIIDQQLDRAYGAVQETAGDAPKTLAGRLRHLAEQTLLAASQPENLKINRLIDWEAPRLPELAENAQRPCGVGLPAGELHRRRTTGLHRPARRPAQPDQRGDDRQERGRLPSHPRQEDQPRPRICARHLLLAYGRPAGRNCAARGHPAVRAQARPDRGADGIQQHPRRLRATRGGKLQIGVPKEHPLVRTRKDGRKSLVIGSTADTVVGMEVAHGRALLARLVEWAGQPAFTYRHEWQEGDFVIWDNRTAMHRVIPYPSDSGRMMHRTSIAAED
jgi:AcrR family transcriptional regulator